MKYENTSLPRHEGAAEESTKPSNWDTFRDRLVPQKTVRLLRGGVSNMTLYRHVQKKIVPPPIVIDGRNYWTLGEILEANEADRKRRG